MSKFKLGALRLISSIVALSSWLTPTDTQGQNLSIELIRANVGPPFRETTDDRMPDSCFMLNLTVALVNHSEDSVAYFTPDLANTTGFITHTVEAFDSSNLQQYEGTKVGYIGAPVYSDVIGWALGRLDTLNPKDTAYYELQRVVGHCNPNRYGFPKARISYRLRNKLDGNSIADWSEVRQGSYLRLCYQLDDLPLGLRTGWLQTHCPDMLLPTCSNWVKLTGE